MNVLRQISQGRQNPTMSRKPWYRANSELFYKLQEEMQQSYPELVFLVRDNKVFLSGNFLLRDSDKIIDNYLIDIEFPFNYPKRIPRVYETGGRIPRIADRHMYSTGECCLYLPFQLAEIHPDGSSLSDFLDNPVRSFFVSQSYFEVTKTWIFDEWPHGTDAVFEYYASRLGTNDKNIISRYLLVISKKEIKGHWLCPCGSGKLLRQCHYELVRRLHKDYHYAIQKLALDTKTPE